jgi:thioredoxin reductase
VIAVVPEGVRIRNNQTGEEQVIACDTVILAAGMTANRQQALQFNDVGASYFAMAGDCIKPKKIRDAVSTGYFAAMEV